MADEKENIEKKDVVPRMSGIMSKASGFARGAVLGGIGGFLFAMGTKHKPVFWTLVGIVGGGFIGHRIAEATDTSKQVKLNFSGIKKRKFKTSK